MAVNAREVLLALSYKYKGEWKKIMSAISNKESIEDVYYEESKSKIKADYLTVIDDDYPVNLRRSNYPPFLLYMYGDKELLSEKYLLSVVGTRYPTMYQNDTVYSLIKEVEEKMNNRAVIVSGMAKGIDQAAMKAAIDSGAPVIAIIGSGIDAPYPSDNQGIYEYCKSGKGLVLSEYPLDIEAKRENFIFRNRLLAALSNVLFVGGGKLRSGTTSTVRYSLDLDKDILALPCNITGDDLTNALIKDGAISVLSSSDIIDALKDNSLNK